MRPQISADPHRVTDRPGKPLSVRGVTLCRPSDSMRRFTNAGPDFTTNTVYNFEGQTIASKGFLTLCKSMADFNVAYAADSPSPRTCDVDIGDSGPADRSNPATRAVRGAASAVLVLARN